MRPYEFAERSNVRKNVVRARNGGVQGDVAPIDPGDDQPERLATDEIGELRLPRMQDVAFRAAGMVDQVSEQSAVGLIAARTFRRAHEIEFVL